MLGIVLLAGATLTACGSDEADAANDATLTVNTEFVVKTLDPGDVYEPTGNVIVHALYETLVTLDGSDITKPVPALAESYTASDDGTEFTFKLRDNAVFADGTAVTAKDVVFSLNRLKNLKRSASTIVQHLSVEAKDDSTVVVTSDVPNPGVPVMLTMPSAGIINSTVAKEHGGLDGEDAATSDSLTDYLNTNTLGSGPYIIESFDEASRIVLAANTKYWGDKPGFGRVVFQNMDTQSQKLAMSKSPEDEIALDIAGTGLDGLPDGLNITSSPDIYYQLRLHADPEISAATSNPKWVAAMRAAMDYDGIAELFGTGGVPASGILPSAFAGSLPSSEAQHQDLDAAKKLLAESGVADETVKLLYPSPLTFGGVDLGAIAAKVQRDAGDAGIKIELDPAPISSFLEQRSAGDVALSFSPQQLDYPVGAQAIADLMPGGGTAEKAGWTEENADPEVVEAANKALAETDFDKQVAAVQEWERLMKQHSPYITLAFNSGVVVASANLTGAEYTAAGWTVDIASIGRR